MPYSSLLRTQARSHQYRSRGSRRPMPQCSTMDVHRHRSRDSGMPDRMSAQARSRTMRAVRATNTSLERRVRAMMAGRGFKGWECNSRELPGHPDFAFPSQRLAVFVDGCFWHGCPECARPLPVANRDYWDRKITRNGERDRTATARLVAEGWLVIRVWEHQVQDHDALREVGDRLARILPRVRRSEATSR